MAKLNWFRENNEDFIHKARSTLIEAICFSLLLVRYININIF